MQCETSPRQPGRRAEGNEDTGEKGKEIGLSLYLLSTDLCYTMCIFVLLYIARVRLSCFLRALSGHGMKTKCESAALEELNLLKGKGRSDLHEPHDC